MLYRTLALRDIRDDAAASVSHALRLGVVRVCRLLGVRHWYSRGGAGLVGGVVGALGGDCAAGRGAGVGAGQALSTRATGFAVASSELSSRTRGKEG